MKEEEVLEELRRDIGDGVSQADLARKMDVSPAYLGDVLHGRKPIGPKVLKYLGLKKVVTVEYRAIK